jgi:hypothetical protein
MAAVLGGRCLDARILMTFGGRSFPLPFMFRFRGAPMDRRTTAIVNHSTIVRGLIGCRMLVSVYESTRIGCTEHTEASGRSRSLARGAGRRCRDRPDLCQPARTRTGGPECHGARKAGSRPLLKHRRVFQGAARRRGTAEAVEGRPTTGKIARKWSLRRPTTPVARLSPDRSAAPQTRRPHLWSHQRTPHPVSVLRGSGHSGSDPRPPP